MLINNIEELRSLMPSIMFEDIDRMSSSLTSAENRLKNVLGTELFAIVILDIELVEVCKMIVAADAYYRIIPDLDLVNDGNGFAVVSDSKLVPASKDRVAALRESVLKKHKDSEALLFETLEESEELRKLWATMPQTTIIPDSLISTVGEFQRFASFDEGFDKWRAQRFRHREIITMKIAPTISREVVDKIIANDEGYRELANQVKAAFVALFIGQDDTAGAMLAEVRNRMFADLEKYPEFANSPQNYKHKTNQPSNGIGAFGF